MNKKGLLIIVSGPSGSGKGTIVDEIKKDNSYALSISATTRPPRDYEKDGIHYFFKSKEQFKKMAENNELLEYNLYCGNYYGTPAFYVEKKLNEGKNVILEIEVHGALNVKKLYKDAILIFLIPPSIQILKERLYGRATESSEVVKMRINEAFEEINIMDKYDYVVINDTIDNAVDSINTIVNAEKMKTYRNMDLKYILKGAELDA